MEFASRDEVADWIDANQLGRRNLTPDAFKLLLGRRYNRAKKRNGERGQQKLDQFDPASTAAKLGKAHGVGEATVKRAGQFAAEVERKPELKAAIEQRKPVLQAKRKMKEAAREARRDENRALIAQAPSPIAAVKAARYSTIGNVRPHSLKSAKRSRERRGDQGIQETKKPLETGAYRTFWRRERDSNPR